MEFQFNEDHSITIKDMKEIIDYVDKIWSHSEIYNVEQEDENA